MKKTKNKKWQFVNYDPFRSFSWNFLVTKVASFGLLRSGKILEKLLQKYRKQIRKECRKR